MSDIPLDTCREVFLLLPAKSLNRFRDVCKSWRAVIDEPCFVRAHTNKHLSSNNTIIMRNPIGPPSYPLYSFHLNALDFTDCLQTITVSVTPLDFPPSCRQVVPVSSCNGLVLVSDDKNLEIWNPLTQERLELPQLEFSSNLERLAKRLGYLELPQLEFSSNLERLAKRLGYLELPQLEFSSNLERLAKRLGYDKITDDYKAVVIHREENNNVYPTYVYSLRSDSWKKIMNCPSANWFSSDRCGVFLCGALNWAIFTEKIKALDLGTGNYRELEQPAERYHRHMHDMKRCLDVLGGCLMMTDFGECYDYLHFDVWVMKDYDASDSWMKLLSFKDYGLPSIGRDLRPVAYMKDKTKIFLQNTGRIYLFDVESGSAKMVSIHGLSEDLYAQFIPGSIFRLHDNCGVGGRRRIMTKESKMNMFDTELSFCVRDAEYFWNGDDPHDSC